MFGWRKVSNAVNISNVCSTLTKCVKSGTCQHVHTCLYFEHGACERLAGTTLSVDVCVRKVRVNILLGLLLALLCEACGSTVRVKVMLGLL
jgi:hypothetical protein